MAMEIKLFDSNMFVALDNNAKNSDRRRSNCNVHQNYDDKIQRLFITLYTDSYVRPHRHSQVGKFEFFLIVSGALSFLIFNETGKCTVRHELSAERPCRGLEIPANTWHSVVPISETVTFFEVKPGPYTEIEDKDFADWAPAESEPNALAFLQALRQLQPGENPEKYL